MSAKEILKTRLVGSGLFTNKEIDMILSTVGSYTMGNCVIACDINGIDLDGIDIDEMFAS